MKINLIKAWKDDAYRSTLSDEQLAQVGNPAGSVALSDTDMQNVTGGTGQGAYSNLASGILFSIDCCRTLN